MSAPSGWRATTIGELGKYFNGRAFKSSEWGDAGRPIIRIQNLTGSGRTFNHFDGDVEDRYIVRPGDLLVSWAATLGAYFWTGPEAVLNQHIFKVESSIEPRFHKYLLDYKLAELQRSAHGSGMVHITRGRFDSVRVSVPGSMEQRRIVDILEDHLSRLDAAEGATVRARKRLDPLYEVAVGNELWAEPKQVRIETLLSEKMRNGHSARAAADGRGIRTLTITAVTKRDFSNTNTKLTTADPSKVGDLWLEPGDILVQRANTPELVGSTAIYDGPRDWAIFPDLLIRLRIDLKCALPAYVALAMQSQRAHRTLRSRAKGLAGSMPKIDQAAIGALEIPLPCLERQAAILRLAAGTIESTARLRAGAETALARSKNLRRALLAAAFSGHLTGAASDSDRIEELAAAL